jgi:putative Holliday junction resolvase
MPESGRDRHPSLSNPPSLVTLLGFDYGLQRIGVAVGQLITGTATALATVRSHNGTPDWDTIAELIRTWRPDALVVGLPLHADGSEAELTPSVKRFMHQLEHRFKLAVYPMDERLSSYAAAQSEGPGNHALRSKGIDALAAREILQSWLEAKWPI